MTQDLKALQELSADLASRLNHQLIDDLPLDSVRGGGPRMVHGAALSTVDLDPAPQPELISTSEEVAGWFQLTPSSLEALLPQLSGSAPLAHVEPYATCYGGHQFGNWAGQLGDGRATGLGVLLGDAITKPYTQSRWGIADPDHPLWEWQLKGAGITPYSRRGDGKAVLRSSVREFLCSEAMETLGIPTTRALSLVTTGEKVWRDMLYDGHPRREQGAIVCRLSPSFVRFGHFELPSARGDLELTRIWLDHLIRRHFFPLWDEDPETDSD